MCAIASFTRSSRESAPDTAIALLPVPQLLPHSTQAPLQQPGDRRRGLAHVVRDLLQRPAVPVLQDQGFALGVRQLLESLSEPQAPLGPVRDVGGTCSRIGEQTF